MKKILSIFLCLYALSYSATFFTLDKYSGKTVLFKSGEIQVTLGYPSEGFTTYVIKKNVDPEFFAEVKSVLKMALDANYNLLSSGHHRFFPKYLVKVHSENKHGHLNYITGIEIGINHVAKLTAGDGADW